MADNCSYEYMGKTYSKDRLVRKLVDELPSRSQQESIDFLIKTLGMLESEIIVIKGLIDNRSLGRFKADGKILLSEYATPDVAYHEAFHRVWRLSLSNEERLVGLQEVRKKKNFGEIIQKYKTIYPKLSDNELIEEFLADEFSDYTLNSEFKIETPIKSLFNKLLNFIKKILGLKPNEIQVIYDKILSGKYKGVKSAQQYLKDADKVLIEGHEFSVEEKNELIQVMTQKFIKAMLDLNGNIDLFLTSPSVNMKRMMDEYVIANMLSDIADNVENSDELITAVYEDFNNWMKSSKFEDSVFMSGMIKNLKLIGLEIKDVPDEELEGALDKDEVSTREFSPSIEFDPKSKMGKKIKLLLSSLTENEKTANFGFPKPLGWTKAFVQIATKMAGIPTSVFREELKALPLSYVNDLVKMLDKDVNFGNEFISTMAMTENRFYRMAYKDGDIFFADANSGTKREKIIGEWRNNLIKQMEDWDEWKAKGQLLYDTKADNEDIMEHLGIELNTQVQNVRQDLLLALDHANKYKGSKPDSKKLFRDLNIEGYIKQLAEKQSAFEDTVDLMVILGSKKLYTLGLNTQQTRIVNNIKYAQSRFTPEMSIAEKIDLLREFAPMQVSEFNVTKKEDGTYDIHNKWLEKILNGEKLDLIIPYMADTESGEDSEIAKLDEADLMAMHLNGALQGVNLSMKHADRGTFFAYTFGNKPLYLKEGTVADTLVILEDNLVEQIELERKFALNMQADNVPVQYIGKDSPGAFFQDIVKDGWKEYLETGKLDRRKVTEFVQDKFGEYKADVQSYGLLEEYTAPIYKDGKKSGQVKRLKGINDKLRIDYGNLDTLLAAAFVNETSSHLFEARFFSGDVRSFKSGTDLFKRLAPQSSTGNLSVNDEVTNEYIRQQINQDFEILDPRTGKKFVVNPKDKIGLNKDGYFRAVTGAERDNYRSHLTDLATSVDGTPLVSKLTGNQESKLFMLFESNFLKDFQDKSLEELKKIYEPKFKLYEENYRKVNENDGISYMVLPAFKKFMIRQGKWTSGMEVVYQTEMKIASMSNMDDIANLEITVEGVTFKPFEIEKGEYKGKKIDGWKKRVVDGKLIQTDAVHTLKTQFGGYSTPEEYYDKSKGEMEYVFNTIFKTSQHLLLPSAILGTNLQLMNSSLLQNGVDIYHMGSANKVGAVDAKLAAKNILNNNDDIRNSRTHLSDLAERGLDFYDKDGYFNDLALTENLDILSYLSPWDDLKNQVQIGNKVKDEIKGSTQSLKILLSNLVTNGNERFEGARQIIQSYKEVVHEMVKTNHDNLLKKIGFDLENYEFTSLDNLKKAILESSQMETAPDNVRNAVQNFFEDVDLGLEAIPMKNKIENVLYALITNGIISFDRPGNAYPQASVTGYEKIGSRKFDENGLQVTNQDTLKFYNPVFDNEGNVIKVEPAEVIMPLPDYWIKPLLRWAKTNNLVKAIEKLNADIENRPELFQFKGLRIPNQQLSSNDIFQVKKFNLPTMQSYIIIPSEMVIKTGGDS